MKVKATTPEMVVVDPETSFNTDGFILFDGKHALGVRVIMTRTLKDHFEIDTEILHADGVCNDCKSKKTFKLYFRDLLQMDLTMHSICSSFKEHHREFVDEESKIEAGVKKNEEETKN